MSRIIILVVFIVNMLSCLIVRKCVHQGRMKIRDLGTHGFIIPETVSVLLAGYLDQPRHAFYRLGVGADRMVYANYSLLGWNARNSAEQLGRHLVHYSNCEINIFAIGIGDKVARDLLVGEYVYAINPIPSIKVLKRGWQPVFFLLAWLMEIATLLLGWIAILPLIPSKSWRMPRRKMYSIALLADQLWETRSSARRRGWINTNLILNAGNKLIDNELTAGYYGTRAVEASLVDANTPYVSPNETYRIALQNLLPAD